MTPGGKKRIDHNLVHSLHISGMSTKDIANKVGCTNVNVSWILRTKFGITSIGTACPWAKDIPENTIGVYVLLNTENGRFYLGSSQDIRNRIIRSHYSQLKNGKGITKELQNDFNKYGEQAFVGEAWFVCESIEEAVETEYTILSFDGFKELLYNKTFDMFDIRNVLTIKYIEKFRGSIDKTQTCWNFTGRINKDGYGEMDVTYGKSRRVLAHRFSYELHKGSCGRNIIGHSCNNKRCVNPEHLYITNHKDNTNYHFKSV